MGSLCIGHCSRLFVLTRLTVLQPYELRVVIMEATWGHRWGHLATDGEIEPLRGSVDGSRPHIFKGVVLDLNQVWLTAVLCTYPFFPRSPDTQAMAWKSGCYGYPVVPQFPA